MGYLSRARCRFA